MKPERSVVSAVALFSLTAAGVVLAALGPGCSARREASRPGGPVAEAGVLERGSYLVRHVTHCFLCHSEIDWGAEGCPPKAGREGAGASPFHEDALPWFSAPNITPDPETGLGRYTDEEIVRALREGVGRDGRTLFPLMPYPLYRGLSDGDVGAIVAYLRTVPPVRNAVPPSRISSEVKGSLAALPPAGPVSAPDRSDPVVHGRYLT